MEYRIPVRFLRDSAPARGYGVPGIDWVRINGNNSIAAIERDSGLAVTLGQTPSIKTMTVRDSTVAGVNNPELEIVTVDGDVYVLELGWNPVAADTSTVSQIDDPCCPIPFIQP